MLAKQCVSCMDLITLTSPKPFTPMSHGIPTRFRSYHLFSERHVVEHSLDPFTKSFRSLTHSPFLGSFSSGVKMCASLATYHENSEFPRGQNGIH